MLKVHGRQAKDAPTYWNVAKTWIQIFFFWGTFLFVLPYFICKLENYFYLGNYFTSPHPKTATVLFVLGGILGIWSGMTMAIYGKGTPLPLDCPQKLVVKGPYAFVRNPMAIGGLSQGVAVGIFLGSLFIILYTFAGMILWNFFVRLWEEQDLKMRFGETFELYKKNVYCWIPRLSAYKISVEENV